ncbi:hypothetical protein GBZ26_05810 [Azospirillum formosense]|uniref:Uncharacterized protein n=1 Tax=Azospirillum formosense TaxID=861533 RepID=A0ABX2KV54_9PROT|nr:hypothetical protein [Azospirillum formosense]MBY3757732.1 hypothetical protein [Azospirillum formosense]NUB18734.1 hypothetical protein [Azospirillum formosense]
MDYDPQNFRDLYETPVGQELWRFLNEPDNIIRMETAIYLERAPVEPLGPGLVAHFGEEISDDRCKQMIGHMVRQIVGTRGYTVDRSGLRITRLNLFTSGTRYKSRSPDDTPDDTGKMHITREQREAWLRKTADSPFNRWLNTRVRNPDGSLNLDKLYDVARERGVPEPERYGHLNPGQQRMILGSMLRPKVPADELNS